MYDQSGFLGTIRNYLKQELRSDICEPYITHFIERDPFVVLPFRHRARSLSVHRCPAPASSFIRAAPVQANSSLLPACRQTQARCQMASFALLTGQSSSLVRFFCSIRLSTSQSAATNIRHLTYWSDADPVQAGLRLRDMEPPAQTHCYTARESRPNVKRIPSNEKVAPCFQGDRRF